MNEAQMLDVLTWPRITVPCDTCIQNVAMWVVRPTDDLLMVYCPHAQAVGEPYIFQPHDPSRPLRKTWTVHCPVTEHEFDTCLQQFPEVLREWRWRWKEREHVTQPKGERP